MSNGNSDGPRTLSSLPPELITLVAEELDLSSLARLAAASTVCLAAAQGELRAALRTAVQRSLVPGAGPVSEALLACPQFCIPDGLAIIPIGAFRETSLISITLPATVTTINHLGFSRCTSLIEITLLAGLTTISYGAFKALARPANPHPTPAPAPSPPTSSGPSPDHTPNPNPNLTPNPIRAVRPSSPSASLPPSSPSATVHSR